MKAKEKNRDLWQNRLSTEFGRFLDKFLGKVKKEQTLLFLSRATKNQWDIQSHIHMLCFKFLPLTKNKWDFLHLFLY